MIPDIGIARFNLLDYIFFVAFGFRFMILNLLYAIVNVDRLIALLDPVRESDRP